MGWLKDKFVQFHIRCQFLMARLFNWLNSYTSSNTPEDSIDFSSYDIAEHRFHTRSFASIYEMSAERKWKWLRNLSFLQKNRQSNQVLDDKEILEHFSDKKELLENTDLSFTRNPLPMAPVQTYINQEAFEDYLKQLAHYRHYHLFAQILFHMLKRNSLNTLDLLKSLLHARNQLIEKQFFAEDYDLFYIENKSQQWIASLMYRIMPQEPKKFIPLGSWRALKLSDFKNNNKILLCDDICYTGTQAMYMIGTLGNKIQKIKITLLFGQMSIYALKGLQEQIKNIKKANPLFEADIITGGLFHTLNAQLDFLPFPPTLKERHIITQLMQADYSKHYTPGDLRKPLLTTAWKKPDYASSYFKFLGYEKEGPDTTAVSSALLPNPPTYPITLFSQKNPPSSSLQLSKPFIAGPYPTPYYS